MCKGGIGWFDRLMINITFAESDVVCPLSPDQVEGKDPQDWGAVKDSELLCLELNSNYPVHP